jgi:hypothetical protein
MSFACSQLTFAVAGSLAGSDRGIGGFGFRAVGLDCGTGAVANWVLASVSGDFFLGSLSGRRAIA